MLSHDNRKHQDLSAKCSDCDMETCSAVIEDAEWYIVSDKVWKQATKDKSAKYLCIGCLEERIGRRLNSDDFPKHILLNVVSWARSERLKNRLGLV